MDNNFADQLVNYMAQDTYLELNKAGQINYLISQMKNWLKEKDELEKSLLNMYNEYDRELELKEILEAEYEPNFKTSDIRILLTRLEMTKKDTIQEYAELNKIAPLFKNGYILLHTFRQVITDQEIEYKILYEAEGEGENAQLAELSLDVSGMLSNTFLSFDGSKANKTAIYKGEASLLDNIRLVSNRSSTRAYANKWLEEHQQSLESILLDANSRRALWDNLIEFRNNRYSRQQINNGRVYEIFKILTSSKRFNKFYSISPKLPTGQNTENKVIALFNRQKGEHLPGWKGGDLGLMQLKTAFGTSTNTLISAGEISNVFKDCINVLEHSKNEKELARGLKRIFTEKLKNLNLELDKRVTRSAIKTINKVVQELDIK